MKKVISIFFTIGLFFFFAINVKADEGFCFCENEDGTYSSGNSSCYTNSDCSSYCESNEYLGGRCIKTQSDYESITISNHSNRNNDQDKEKKEEKPLKISTESLPCEEVLGKNTTKLVKAAITIFQIVAIIFSVVKGMLIIVPAVTAKGDKELGNSLNKLAIYGGILLAALIFRPIIVLIGKFANLDVSCITWIINIFF